MTLRSCLRTTALACCALLVLQASPASAYDFTRPLQVGDEGADVLELQIRVAGWFSRADQRRLRLTGVFDRKTANAVSALQTHFGLLADGVANQKVLDLLNALEDPDASTRNFDWLEFVQNKNSSCSREANRYAGSFKGGPVPRETVRENVRRLMWRLEALRAKLGNNPIGINSGYRSVAYNKCIGGASMSQHLYGTAADLRVANVGNRRARNVAKTSQFHGIACYSRFTHNHLDSRLWNEDLTAAHYWWWPERDDKGRDLDETHAVCWGETGTNNRMLNTLRATSSVPIISAREAQELTDGHEEIYAGLAD